MQEAWLRLNTLEMAPHRIHALLEAFGGSPAAIFKASAADVAERLPSLNAKRLDHISTVRNRDMTKDRAALAKSGAHLVTIADANYPINLRQLPDAPPVLIVRGELIPEDKFSLAIVGSRRATSYGLGLARQFARELAQHGLTIVSGGARGVDTEAHRGALEANGRTLSYLGCGVDCNYPRENSRLFSDIAEGHGAVLSEFPMGTKPEPWRFPARNRLISGTSLGVCKVSPKAISSITPGRNTTRAPADLSAAFRQYTRSMMVPTMSRLTVPATSAEVSTRRAASRSCPASGALSPARFGCWLARSDRERLPRRSSRSLRSAASSPNTAL